MANNNLPRIPCPLCDGCDHDLRGDLLDLVANIGENLRGAGDSILTAMETEGDAVDEFAEAIRELVIVRKQVTELLGAIPEMAQIKAAKHA